MKTNSREAASPQLRSRRRAVRLTEKGMVAVCEALDSAWSKSGGVRAITAEDRARLLDVSVVTARRILKGEGVDRASLLAAFKSLSIEWKDSYCEFVSPPPTDVRASASRPIKQIKWSPRQRAWSSVALATLAGAVLIAFLPRLLDGKGHSGHTVEEEYAQQLIDQATSDYDNAKYDQARVLIAQAKNIARRHQNAPILINAELIEAKLAVEQGDYPRARKCYSDALYARRMLGEHGKVSAVLEDLADVEAKEGRLEAARRHLMEARVGFEALHDPVGVLMAERDLGSVFAQAGDLARANECFQLALQSAESMKKPDFLADIRLRKALVLRDQRRWNEARGLIDQALAYWRSQGHPRWIARCLLNLGTVEAAEGHVRQAEDLLVQSKLLYQKLGDEPGAKECDAWLGNINGRLASENSANSARFNRPGKL